jgi:hypothetical protein
MTWGDKSLDSAYSQTLAKLQSQPASVNGRPVGEKPTKQRLSKVGDTSTGVLACPKCKGTSFKAKRSLGAKLTLGTAGVVALGVAPIGAAAAGLAEETRVKCTICGTEYKRG